MLIGSTLYAVLPGMEFAVVAAHETGADLAQTQAALESWFVPILIVGAVTFAFGTVLFAVAVARAASFARLPTVIVAGALVVFGLSRVVPVRGVQFHVQSVAALRHCCRWPLRSAPRDRVPVPVDLRCLIILAIALRASHTDY